MARCLIGLGANLGPRANALDQALALLAQRADSRLLARSRYLPTAPIGGPPGQPEFLNAAALIETSLPPLAVCQWLLDIERRLGRQRAERWGPRALDLDLLLYDELTLDTPELVVPHPRMAFRRFVLEPAAEAAPHMRHPEIGWTVAELWRHLASAPPYFAITGPTGVGKSSLARRLVERTGGEYLPEPVLDDLLVGYYADPAQHAWRVETALLARRAALLRGPRLAPPAFPPAISDFWFDQSLAFARLSLAADDWPRFVDAWRAEAAAVTKPKLLIVLDASSEQLLAQIQRRGRTFEQGLAPTQLDALRRAIAEQVAASHAGPRLRLSAADPEAAFAEAAAAVAAMR